MRQRVKRATLDVKTFQQLQKIPQVSMEDELMTIIDRNSRRFARKAQYAVAAAVFMTVCPWSMPAQDDHAHMTTAQEQEAALDAQTNANTLLKVVRDATEKYKDVAAAKAAGYVLQFGCVTGEDTVAMGLHYINPNIVNSGVLDPTRPQIIIYEPTPGGGQKLIGADFLVFAEAWNLNHSGPPMLMGQLFHLFPAPNRFGLPAFYTLHVWAWKPNPSGAFVNWHPNVSCQSFSAQ